MSRTVIVLAWAASIGLACVSASAADPAPASRPAFPGAEGFGAAAVGGRGGRVLKVTSLEADGPGSLQWACAQKGPRIVVFDVSGVIPVRNGSLKVGDGHITIAGQTAPGAGITVEGMLSCRGGTEGFTDVVVRFVRFRPKKEGTGDHAVLFTDTRRFILDHVSGSWGMDENFGLSTCGDFTVQWCAIEESDWPGPLSEYRVGDGPWYRGGGNHPHSFGMIMGYVPNGNATLHHNLFAHHNRRTPLCGIEPLDHRNNVIYDVKEGIMFHPPRFNKDRPDKPFRANIVGDTFKEGPSCPKITEGKNLPDKVGGGRWMVAESPGEIYAAGNWFGSVGKVADVWTEQIPAVSMGKSIKAEKPWPCPPVTTQPAEQAYRLVLAHVGCLPRDAVGRRTIDDTRNATGEWGRHDPPGGLMAGLAPGKAPADADGDGMPDDWEKAHGLNPANPADATKLVPAGASEADRHRGYTYIEFYANDLADRLVAEAMKQAKED